MASIKESSGVWVLPQGVFLISVNGTQESMYKLCVYVSV